MTPNDELKMYDPTDDGKTRRFTTGASRDTAQDKLDFEGFLCPLVLERYAEYMNKNRRMRDGSLRDSDNWQKGIPKDVYVKSLWRHFHEAWKLHRSEAHIDDRGDVLEALCGVLFNAMGYMHEHMKEMKASRRALAEAVSARLAAEFEAQCAEEARLEKLDKNLTKFDKPATLPT